MTLDSINFDYFALCIFYILTDTGSEYDGTDKSGNTTDCVDSCGTCEIDEAHLSEPAVRVPYPACLDRIYNEGKDSRVDTI